MSAHWLKPVLAMRELLAQQDCVELATRARLVASASSTQSDTIALDFNAANVHLEVNICG